MSDAKKRVLIVGVGSIGERHLRCFQQTGRAEVALCEVNEALRTTIVDRYQVAQAYPSLQAALERPFDAAVIATPAPSHIPLAMETARRGIHLLIEKPLSTSAIGVDELAALCAEQRVIAAVAYVMRCHPALVAAREAIGSERFGRPLQVVVVSGQNFPFYRPAYRDTYYAKRESGGGAIQDALTHFVNAVEWMVGPADRVLADAAHLAVPGVEVEDTVHVVARHGDVLAAYTLNQHQAPNESTITVVCERGVVRASLSGNRWSYVTDPQSPWTEETFPTLERDDLFVRQAERFLDAIDGGPVACPLTDGAATLRTNIAILAASDAPAWTHVDADKKFASTPHR